MREVLQSIRGRLTPLSARSWWGLLAALGVALALLPVIQGPGYELALGLTVLCALLGGPFAVSASRPPSLSPGLDAIAVALALASSTVPAVVVSVLRTALASPCDPWLHLAFVPVLVLPTCLLVAPLAWLISRVTRRAWVASLLWLGVLLGSGALAAWPIVFGPQVFFFGHLLGWVPGPLYDEALSLTPALGWFRLCTLCLATGLLALLARRRRLTAVALTAAFALELSGTRLGFRMSDRALADELGGELSVEGLELHYPAGFSDEEVSRLLGDLRFRHHQLVEFFGEAPEGVVRVWWYRSAEQKQRLVGAAHTQFAKPWRREIHVNGKAFPHPVIKHELVHALAAPWGARPWGVTSRLGGLSLNVGVIEGFAVAADNPVDDLSLEGWAAAMQQKGLLPDVRALMTPAGFYRVPHSRAYATAGAFLRFLADRHGRAGLRTLYRAGDFQAAFGKSLDALASDFEAHLRTVPLEPSAVTQAFSRFRQGSLFDRPCAREVVHLQGVSAAAPADKPDDALQAVRRCRALQPGDPGHPLAEARQLRRSSRLDDAARLLDAELGRLEDDPAAWADAALARADLAQELGDAATARALWERLLTREPAPAVDRTARVRLASLDLSAPAREAVRGWFAAGGDDVKLLALAEAGAAEPQAWAPAYLLGRALATQADEPTRAIRWLDQAIALGPPPSVLRESHRVRLEVLFALGRCDELRASASAFAPDPAFAARARDWVERCAWTHPSR